MKKTLPALLCTLLLTACGFQLRGEANLPFETLYVQAPTGSQFAIQVRRMITAGSSTKIIDNAPVLGCTGGALWSDEFRPGPAVAQAGFDVIEFLHLQEDPEGQGQHEPGVCLDLPA